MRADTFSLLGYVPGRAPVLRHGRTGEAFRVRMDDPHEPTVVVSRPLANHLPAASTRRDGLRFMLLGTPLGPDLMGFIAARTTAPVGRTVPIVMVGTASRDHLTVPRDTVATALGVLRQ